MSPILRSMSQKWVNFQVKDLPTPVYHRIKTILSKGLLKVVPQKILIILLNVIDTLYFLNNTKPIVLTKRF